MSSKKKLSSKRNTKKTKKKTTKKQTTKDNQYTYLIKSNYLNMKTIKPLFKERGNWKLFNENSNSSQHPTFLYVDGTFIQDSSLWKYKPFIKNLVNDKKYSIAYKNNLFENMKKHKQISNYILPQYNIDLNDYKDIDSLSKFKNLFSKNNVWIFKPVGGFSGKGIVIFNNYNHFFNTTKKIINKNKNKWKNIKNKKQKVVMRREWILQQYINKPLLYKGKKFHMKVYFLYYKELNKTTNKIVKKGYILDVGRIYTGLKKFKADDYYNNDIHDTHNKSTPKPIYFWRDFTKEYGEGRKKKALIDLKNIFSVILKCIDADCYKESKYCYELFGADIMLNSSFDMKLIEVNTKVGYKAYENETIDIHKIIIGNILETVIDPLCPPKNKPKLFKNMIEV